MRTRLVAAVFLVACGSPPGGGEDDGGIHGDSPVIDGAPADDAQRTLDGLGCVTCGAACCEDGQTCAYGVCVSAATCATGDDCQNDSHCDTALGLCIPFESIPGLTFDPSCKNVVTVGVFAPSLQCEWTGPPPGDMYPSYRNVMATPLVADFDLDDDPTTLHPSIVAITTDDSSGYSCFDGVIRLIDGQSCAQQLTITAMTAEASSTLALGDLDEAPDGRPEIVALRSNGGIVAFRYDEAVGNFIVYWSNEGAFGCAWTAISIHDLDDDGVPEVILGDVVFDGRTGVLRAAGSGSRSHHPSGDPSYEPSVVSDLDADGRPEVVSDSQYEWDPTSGPVGDGGWVLQSTLPIVGRNAVADFGTFNADPALDDRGSLDGIAEIVVVAGATSVMSISGRVVFTAPGGGGPPTIADFDGDGRVEIGVASGGAYTISDPDCAGVAPDPATCASGRTDGVLWSSPSQDYTSGITGSAVFDFEGDGHAEVIYADECFARVYDGRTGDVLYSRHHTSCTWIEYAIAADVDGDFNTEIVIPSNDACYVSCPAIDPRFDGLRCLIDAECPGTTTCALDVPGDPFGRCRCTTDADCGGAGFVCTDPIAGPSPLGKVCRASHPSVPVQGIQVIRDPLDRWVNSRPIWNQYAYSVTNVNDDGSIPRTSEWVRNWTVPHLNNFRANSVGSGRIDAVPDLTLGLSFACTSDPEFGETAGLRARLCNRGAGPVAPGVPITLYSGDPAAGAALCTMVSTMVLAPGQCEVTTCDHALPIGTTIDVTGVADDDAGGSAELSHECFEGNNRAVLLGVACDGGIG